MKKLFVLLLSGLLIVSSVPSYSLAAVNKSVASSAATTKAEPTVTSTTEPTDEALQSAILAVKDKITIPSEYSNFNYYFYDTNSYSDGYWNLTWTKPDTGASITVSCDLDYHITSYNKYDYSTKNSGIATYLRSELKKKAEDFIGKIAPQTDGHLEFVSSQFTGIYNGEYTYYYQRIENGIDFPDNSVTVSVNSVTGEVTSASIIWIYGVTIPSATTDVTKDQATDKIKDNMKMKLVYKSNNYIIYDKGINSSSDIKAFLVYEPTENYISVDAKTGKVYDTRTQWEAPGADNHKEASSNDSMKAVGTGAASALTDDEIAKIKELQNLISKSKAIKLVTENTSLYRDKNMTQYSATLSQWYYSSKTTKYVWNVSLTDPRKITEKDNYRGYAYATVDAKTGKILAYNASVKSNYDDANQKWNTVSIKYNKDQCRKTFEKFAKSELKDYFNNSILANQTTDYVAYFDKKNQPVYGGYFYQYNRVNEGIEFPDNMINGAVDGITGKIYSFGAYWNENVTFESSKGVISADEAMKDYLGKDGYGLKYEITDINKNNDSTGTYTVKREVRLVYRPDINPSYISPFTGEQLNSDGSAYTKQKTYSYKDIAATDANRNILLLADMNIGFEGENFLPNQNVTIGDIKSLLSSVGYGYSNIQGNDTDLITKEEMAQIFINWLGLEKISKLNVYTTGFADNNSIDSKYVGAVALAKGLGIISGDSSNNFNPKNKVTRADAVNMVVNFINVQYSEVLY